MGSILDFPYSRPSAVGSSVVTAHVRDILLCARYMVIVPKSDTVPISDSRM